MRVAQPVVAAAIIISGVIADADIDYDKLVDSIQKGSSSSLNTTPKPSSPLAEQKSPAKEPTKVQKALGTVSKVANLAFGKVERTKERKAKKGAQYIKKQKSTSEIKTDATGTKQPASLSNPNVDFMEAWSDLIKRYKGVEHPNKEQFREDVKTVFESRAEEGDKTTKAFRQKYKVYKSKGPGIGKRAVKKEKKKAGKGKDKRDAEEGLDVREAEPAEELEIEAREAEPEADAEAFPDPEATIYQESELFERDAIENLEVVERDVAEDYQSLDSRGVNDEDEDVPKKPKKNDDDDEDDDSPKKDQDVEDLEDDDTETPSKKKATLKKAAQKKAALKKAALKKKLAMKRLAAMKKAAIKKKLLAGKKSLAQKKTTTSKKANKVKSKAAKYSDIIGTEDDEDLQDFIEQNEDEDEEEDYELSSKKAKLKAQAKAKAKAKAKAYKKKQRLAKLKAALLKAEMEHSLAEANIEATERIAAITGGNLGGSGNGIFGPPSGFNRMSFSQNFPFINSQPQRIWLQQRPGMPGVVFSSPSTTTTTTKAVAAAADKAKQEAEKQKKKKQQQEKKKKAEEQRKQRESRKKAKEQDANKRKQDAEKIAEEAKKRAKEAQGKVFERLRTVSKVAGK